MPLTGPNRAVAGWDYNYGNTPLPLGEVSTKPPQQPPQTIPPPLLPPIAAIPGADDGLGVPQPQNQTQIPGQISNQQPGAMAQAAPQVPGWPMPAGSNIDPSMFLPGMQQIPNPTGGNWPVEFQPVAHDPFAAAAMGGGGQQGGYAQQGVPVQNNNLATR